MKNHCPPSVAEFNPLKPIGYSTYHKCSEILHGANTTFMCFVRISEQTAAFVLYYINRVVLYNRNGEGMFTAHKYAVHIKHFSYLKC